MKISLTALTFLTILTTRTAAASRQLQESNTTSQNWWDFGLADPVLNEVALYYLGEAWHKSADVADVLETIGRVNNTDPWSWTIEWQTTAQRMERLAKESLDGGECHDAVLARAGESY